MTLDKKDNFEVNMDDVTVNGVKAKSFSLNMSDGSITVDWVEDFNLRELINSKGVVDGVNKRLDKFGVDYVDSFYDNDALVLYIRTNDISNFNRNRLVDCLECNTEDIVRLSDKEHSLLSAWLGKGWFAVNVGEDE